MHTALIPPYPSAAFHYRATCDIAVIDDATRQPRKCGNKVRGLKMCAAHYQKTWRMAADALGPAFTRPTRRLWQREFVRAHSATRTDSPLPFAPVAEVREYTRQALHLAA